MAEIFEAARMELFRSDGDNFTAVSRDTITENIFELIKNKTA